VNEGKEGEWSPIGGLDILPLAIRIPSKLGEGLVLGYT
jgi:hypothetical protein